MVLVAMIVGWNFRRAIFCSDRIGDDTSRYGLRMRRMDMPEGEHKLNR